jgi:hypothetical protein
MVMTWLDLYQEWFFYVIGPLMFIALALMIASALIIGAVLLIVDLFN